MVYWIVSTVRPRWSPMRSAIVAGAVAFAVELFKLHHAPGLDGFRLTMAGKLLLGRVFSLWDLVAYAVAMAAGASADRGLRATRPAAISS
nr:DUF2809 domain-containing protein [Sphingomonas quercus]